ncbi:hypothetical protein [Oceanithermus sp.]
MRRGFLLVLLLLGGALAARLPLPYAEYIAARDAGDAAALERLSREDGYVQILAARELSRLAELPAEKRLEFALKAAGFDGASADWLAVARLRQRLGRDGATSAYARALPLEEAKKALLGFAAAGNEVAIEALYRDGDYEELLRVLPKNAVSWRARALYRLGRYEEALPWYQVWATDEEAGRWGLARTLLKLGDYDLAAAVYRNLPGPAARTGLGEALEAAGKLEEAAAAYAAGDARGLWRAAGIYEKLDRLEEALKLYRRLARGDSLYADDATLRLWVLARRRRDAALERWAYGRLEGGLAVLVGKPGPELPEGGSISITPPHATRIRALAAAGREDWAWGEVRWQLAAEDTPDRRRSYAGLLEDLGLWGQALKLTKRLPRNSRSDWMMDYPLAYEDRVRSAAGEFGL